MLPERVERYAVAPPLPTGLDGVEDVPCGGDRRCRGVERIRLKLPEDSRPGRLGVLAGPADRVERVAPDRTNCLLAAEPGQGHQGSDVFGGCPGNSVPFGEGFVEGQHIVGCGHGIAWGRRLPNPLVGEEAVHAADVVIYSSRQGHVVAYLMAEKLGVAVEAGLRDVDFPGSRPEPRLRRKALAGASP